MWLRRKTVAVWNFYLDGFRNMTWGKALWVVIVLKLFIMFAVLRIFFFRPVLSGKTDEENGDIVFENLTQPYYDRNSFD